MIPAWGSVGKAIGQERRLLGVVYDFRGGMDSPRLTVFFTLDPFVDLFAVNGHILGGVHADAHLIPLDAQNSHRDLVSDHDRFTDSSCQYQHNPTPSFLGICSGAFDRVGNRMATDGVRGDHSIVRPIHHGFVHSHTKNTRKPDAIHASVIKLN